MFEGRKVKQAGLRIALQRLEIEEKLLNNISESNAIKPEADEGDWFLMGENDKELNIQDAETLRTQAIKAYYKNGHGRNIIRLFEKYIAGRGFLITPKSSLPEVNEVWKDFWIDNKMELKKKEIVRRGMRDGEAFLRYFPCSTKTPMQLRFMNPELITEPDKEANNKVSATFGIETDIEDIESVSAYYYKDERLGLDKNTIQHIKILVDSDAKRGRSFYEPLLENLYGYKAWMKDRLKLNKIRATMAIVKTVTGNPTQAANIKDANQTSRTLNKDGTTLQKAPKGVSIYTTNKGVEYEFKSPNLQASDVQKDGRSILLAMSAGSGMPEFMVSSDASNGSYASTMVAEGPAIMEFEDWQDFFGEAFKEMFRIVIKDALEFGIIPQSEEVVTEEIDSEGIVTETVELQETSLECLITFPDLVSRDIEKETRALAIQSEKGWISDETVSAKLDLKFEDEQRMIKKKEASEEPDEEELDEEDEEEMEKEPEKPKEPENGKE